MPGETDLFSQYVDRLPNKKWICKFCLNEYSGSSTKIKAHLAGLGVYGIRACEHVDGRVRSSALKVFGYKKLENHVSSEKEGWWRTRFNNLAGGGTGVRRIGKISVSSAQLGKGSNGTIVLEGEYEGRPVAVKRLVGAHHDAAFNEIQNLIASDRHPNIVRWYGVECDWDFVYLALERCTCSLDDLIQLLSESSKNPVYPDFIQLLSESSKTFVFPEEDQIKLDSLRVMMKDVNLWRADGHPSTLLVELMR